ncbi:hypothetical protein JCM10908_000681 [Rhodotorula pacifica]|uniref:uncharacterized protein n=1 Tax=Rhodotorula pacifica TaxID=1495444 RepID=UPI00317CB679
MYGLTPSAPEPEPGMPDRVSSNSASPAPALRAGSTSSGTSANKQSKKRKTIELTLPDSDSDDADDEDVRAKIARLEAEVSKLRQKVKAEPGAEPVVKTEPSIKIKEEKIKKEKTEVRFTEDNGRVVLDLLDD